MIYDYIDLNSKRGLVAAAMAWLKDPNNAKAVKQVCKEHNVFGRRIPTEREDSDLIRMLFMVGAGAIVPIISKEQSGFALRLHWAIPFWVLNRKAWQNLSLHVEQMIEAHEIAVGTHLPSFVLEAALDRFHVEHLVNAFPRPPNTDMEKDLALQEELRYDTGEFKRQWHQEMRRVTKANRERSKT
jgi:hypothetical protein